MPRVGHPARRLVRAGSAAALLSATALWWAGVAPAHAAGFTVTAKAQPGPASGPADAEVISGTTQADTAQQVTEVDVSVVAVDAGGNPDATRPVPSCAKQAVKPDQQTGDYSTAACAYPYNGTYKASVVAKEQGLTGTTTSAPVFAPFGIYVAPAAPTGVTAKLSSAGDAVTVSWTANPEPDVAYAVVRDGQQLGNPTTATSVTDSTVSPATTYHYQVVAARAGPNNSVLTATSQAVAVDTPAPPPTTAPPPSGGSAAGSGGGGSNVAVPGGTSSAPVSGKTPVVVSAPKLDLSSFASVLDKARAAPAGAAALPGEGEGPDTGYNATLPFGSQTASQTEDGGGDTAAVGPNAAVLGPSDASHNVRPWAMFGFGVLLSAVLAHVVWMRAELNRAGALEPLPVEAETGASVEDG